jgi:hypothetical protein
VIARTISYMVCLVWGRGGETPGPKPVSELYQQSDHRMLEKLVPIFAERGYYMVSAADPYGHILAFPDWSRYFFFQVAPQLYSRG